MRNMPDLSKAYQMNLIDEFIRLGRERIRLLDQGGQAERIWEIDKRRDKIKEELF